MCIRDSAQRAIQDRTGAEEASVPIEDQDAVKHAHDALLSAASAALPARPMANTGSGVCRMR